MGSGRDKRKKSRGSKPGVGHIKTEKKNAKRELKEERRLARKEAGEGDTIDALLAKFKLVDAENGSVEVVEQCSPPTARVFGSAVALAASDKEVLFFGGEWLDPVEDVMHVYADCFVFNAQTRHWKQIISPGGPLPRSRYVRGTRMRSCRTAWNLLLQEFISRPCRSAGSLVRSFVRWFVRLLDVSAISVSPPRAICTCLAGNLRARTTPSFGIMGTRGDWTCRRTCGSS
jgi:hypothetical protein